MVLYTSVTKKGEYYKKNRKSVQIFSYTFSVMRETLKTGGKEGISMQGTYQLHFRKSKIIRLILLGLSEKFGVGHFCETVLCHVFAVVEFFKGGLAV